MGGNPRIKIRLVVYGFTSRENDGTWLSGKQPGMENDMITLWLFNIAMENGPLISTYRSFMMLIDDKMVIFHSDAKQLKGISYRLDSHQVQDVWILSLARNNNKTVIDSIHPLCSMYGIFTYIWVIFGANAGKYSIHGASGHLACFLTIHHWQILSLPLPVSRCCLFLVAQQHSFAFGFPCCVWQPVHLNSSYKANPCHWGMASYQTLWESWLINSHF